MKEQLNKLIERHNAVVDALESSELQVPEGKMFRAMTIWYKLACEGHDITQMAREAGIDAKCDMQAGRIYVYGDIKPDGDTEGICPICGAELEYTGDDVKTCGGGMHPWKCPGCGATGEEGYNEVFDGQHYNVRDKDGKAVEGGEQDV